MQLKRQLLKIINKSTYTPTDAEGIIKIIGFKKGISVKSIEKSLKQLILEGRIIQDKNGNYLISTNPEVTGVFEANKKGFGFVLTQDFDVYIKSTNVGDTMNRDTVEAVITKRKKGLSFEGIITKVIERSAEKVIGRLEQKGNCQIVIPTDRRLFYTFEVEEQIEYRQGLIVEAKVTAYPKGGVGKCKVIEIIGGEEEPGVEIEVILREHSIRTKFPYEAEKQAKDVPTEVKNDDIKGRVDYRDDYVVTIDGLDAKDFDDAIQISKDKGEYNLNVHIADVSHYVKPDAPIDLEASLRCFSTYLPDRVIPMLPEVLSNNICSLNPGVDRLTMSVDMTLDKRGNVIFSTINKGVINSKARLTYSQVDKDLADGKFENEEQKQTLRLMAELSDILEERRTRQGSMNFETIEPKIIVDKNFNPTAIEIREKSPATTLIEEAMVLTNEVVAKFIHSKNLPLMYRIHENPNEDALEEVRLILGQMGYPSKKMSKATSDAFQNILKFAHQRKDKLIINSILLRLMKKARYSTLAAHHFGLGLTHYAHFTSPIRRYPDLLVHRQVKAVLDKKNPMDEELLSDFAKESSIRERESESAEREADMVYICLLMKSEIGSAYKGIISGVTNFGLFVQLPNSAEGLVHISNIKGDYYRYEQERFLLRGVRTGQVFRLGQSVKVKLVNVVVGERQIDLSLD